MPRRKIRQIHAFKWNIYTVLKNVFIHRDKRVVLVGSWMGLKFADNSRYLFQFLVENRELLGLERVIWVTRNPNVVKTLTEMGYESYIIGSKESNYWHLKAGIHILCNAINDIPNFHADIDTKLSLGAKKIQLWHGVGGIKAVGAASNLSNGKGKKYAFLKKILHTRFFNTILSEGGWAEAHVLSTSMESTKALIACIGCRLDRFFITGYPRNCSCPNLLKSEECIIKKIQEYNGSVLYLPTFRSDNTDFVHPLSDPCIRAFIKENNILWIEKPHSADLNKDAIYTDTCSVLDLDSSFDINTIYNNVTCVITDYSSVAFDAVFHNKPLIVYAPDINRFRNGDVGFIIDFESFFKAELCENTECLCVMLDEAIMDNDKYVVCRNDSYNFINQYAYDNRAIGFEQIWEDICKLN